MVYQTQLDTEDGEYYLYRTDNDKGKYIEADNNDAAMRRLIEWALEHEEADIRAETEYHLLRWNDERGYYSTVADYTHIPSKEVDF